MGFLEVPLLDELPYARTANGAISFDERGHFLDKQAHLAHKLRRTPTPLPEAVIIP